MITSRDEQEDLLISSGQEITEVFHDVVKIVKDLAGNYNSKDPDDLSGQPHSLLDVLEIINDRDPTELKEFVEVLGLNEPVMAIKLHHLTDSSFRQICCNLLGNL